LKINPSGNFPENGGMFGGMLVFFNPEFIRLKKSAATRKPSCSSIFSYGAGGRTRTGMLLPAADFEFYGSIIT
jgi:hypothetical protein